MGGGQDERNDGFGEEAESWVSDCKKGTGQPLGVASHGIGGGGGVRGGVAIVLASIPDTWVSVRVYLSDKPPFP